MGNGTHFPPKSQDLVPSFSSEVGVPLLPRRVPSPGEAQAPEARPGAQARPPLNGLVPNITSVTQAPSASDPLPLPDRDKSKAYRLERSVLTAASQINLGMQESGESFDTVLVTLTYRNPDWSQWSPGDITSYIRRTREWLRRRSQPCRYVWVCELQKRGAPHYHVIFWLSPGTKLPMPDKSGAWVHGLSRIEKAHKPVGYLVGYAKKNQDFRGFPSGARVCGSGGLTEAQRAAARWWKSPNWLKRKLPVDADVMPAPGGGYVDRSTGEYFWPEWTLTARNGRFYLIKKKTPAPEPFVKPWRVETMDWRHTDDSYLRPRARAVAAEVAAFVADIPSKQVYLRKRRAALADGKDFPPYRKWRDFKGDFAERDIPDSDFYYS